MSSWLSNSATAIFAGGKSVCMVNNAAILPLTFSGNSAIAFELKVVTGCFSKVSKSRVMANANLMPKALNGYSDKAV